MSVVGNIHVENISKTFNSESRNIEVLKNVDFTIKNNEFLVLFGPGQCGKSVLMEIIAGLIDPTDGKVLYEDGTPLPNKDICMVFQRYALFPWKTVLQNVEMPMKFKGIPKAERRERAKKYLDLVGLTDFADKYPRQISGGMKQRVALARAYAKECDLLLFDEPFGALDAQTRYFMEDELVRIWEKERKTVVFITNNIEEAVYLADRIIVLGGTPSSITSEYQIDFARPRNRSDADFLAVRKTIEKNSVHSDVIDSR